MTNRTWRIEVDRVTCMGSGTCVVIAPDHFALVDDRARAIETSVSPDDAVIDAAESCPAEAILVRGTEDGGVLAPRE